MYRISLRLHPFIPLPEGPCILLYTESNESICPIYNDLYPATMIHLILYHLSSNPLLSPELARLFNADRTLYSPLMRLSIYPTSDDRLCCTSDVYFLSPLRWSPWIILSLAPFSASASDDRLYLSSAEPRPPPPIIYSTVLKTFAPPVRRVWGRSFSQKIESAKPAQLS